MMSRRDYETLAAIVRELPAFADGPALEGASDPDAVRENVRRGAATMMADYFAAGNPRFDRAIFMAACGVQS